MMELTNQDKIKLKEFCIKSAIDVQTLYPKMPLVVDINAIPKLPNFNIGDWDKLTEERGIAYLDSTKGEVNTVDINDTILKRAKGIYNWITE